MLVRELLIQEGAGQSAVHEYALLPASDMPEIVVELIETVDEAGPFGAKGSARRG